MIPRLRGRDPVAKPSGFIDLTGLRRRSNAPPPKATREVTAVVKGVGDGQAV
jgi:hypothetical protein